MKKRLNFLLAAIGLISCNNGSTNSIKVQKEKAIDSVYINKQEPDKPTIFTIKQMELLQNKAIVLRFTYQDNIGYGHPFVINREHNSFILYQFHKSTEGESY